MKVILLRDVAKVGRKYDVVEVTDGYANNFLFGRRLAERATPERIAVLDRVRAAHRAEEDARMADLKEKLSLLGDKTVVIPMKADEQGHLFKKIRTEDLRTAFHDQVALELRAEAITLDEPIQAIGEYDVPIEVAGMRSSVKIEVVRE